MKYEIPKKLHYLESVEYSKSLPFVEKTIKATSASQSTEISCAFLSSPDLLFEKVTCLLILFSILFSWTLPLPITLINFPTDLSLLLSVSKKKKKTHQENGREREREQERAGEYLWLSIYIPGFLYRWSVLSVSNWSAWSYYMYIYRKVQNHYGWEEWYFQKQQWFRQNVVELLLAGASWTIVYWLFIFILHRLQSPNHIFPILNLITMIQSKKKKLNYHDRIWLRFCSD